MLAAQEADVTGPIDLNDDDLAMVVGGFGGGTIGSILPPPVDFGAALGTVVISGPGMPPEAASAPVLIGKDGDGLPADLPSSGPDSSTSYLWGGLAHTMVVRPTPPTTSDATVVFGGGPARTPV